MKYHIDTIPVWDAVKAQAGCPLCMLRVKVEQQDVERFLGGSVMEPDVRVRVNEKGFCSRHHQLLYAQRNRLGHALMVQSHLDVKEKELDKAFDRIEKAAKALSEAPLTKRITGNRDAKAEFSAAGKALQSCLDTCIICESIKNNMTRYIHTFLHLFKTDTAFRKAFEQGAGLCIPHVAAALETAAEVLSPSETQDLIQLMRRMHTQTVHKMQTDIDGFTKKFDYRNADKPWGDSKGSLERTVNYLKGYSIGEEPGKA